MFASVARQRISRPLLRHASTTLQDLHIVDNESRVNRLYVGNVPFELTELELREALEPFGPVDGLRIAKEPGTGKSRGFAYVGYRTQQQAEAIINANLTFYNRKLLVQYGTVRPQVQIEKALGLTKPPPKPADAKPSTRLFVGNLPFECSVEDAEKAMHDLFAAVGSLLDMHCGVDASGAFRGFCHVEFVRLEDAQKAHDALVDEPAWIGNRKLIISYAMAKKSHPTRGTLFDNTKR
uniref:RNA binding domain-containing protein n=1 Tax=Mycena chlorophos TaxID=658473 RepID=A0ABQ0M696_MYCCL|nr:RNA binding domain-containing protein [Mycena chlorophos]